MAGADILGSISATELLFLAIMLGILTPEPDDADSKVNSIASSRRKNM